METSIIETEKVARWMLSRSYATGHGDTVEDMLAELEGQARQRGASLITNEDITSMADMPTLGPGWSASRRIADKLMKDWTDDRFKSLIDEFSKRFNEHLWDDVQASLQGDVEFNISGYIRQMVDETVEALLKGDNWAMGRYPLSKLYDAESIRTAIAKHIPAELQDKRIADLEAANKRMSETIENMRMFL